MPVLTIRQHDLVAVYWLDAATAIDEGSIAPSPVVTVGFVKEINDDYIRVASETGPPLVRDDEEKDWGRNYTAIPRGMVLCIKRLPKIQTPDAVHQFVRDRKAAKKARTCR